MAALLATPDHENGSTTRTFPGVCWTARIRYFRNNLQQVKVASIENGLASVPIDANKIKQELDPHPNTDGYVWVVQLSEHQWYRTPDISPEHFWNDLPASIGLLGTSSLLQTGETQLVLPSLSKRRLTLLYPDGRPKARTAVTLSLYLWNHNHCGAHRGLPLGSFQTDENGVIEVLSQRVRLFLEDTWFFEEAGPGPAGVAYSTRRNQELSSSPLIGRGAQGSCAGRQRRAPSVS